MTIYFVVFFIIIIAILIVGYHLISMICFISMLRRYRCNCRIHLWKKL